MIQLAEGLITGTVLAQFDVSMALPVASSVQVPHPLG